MTSQPLYDPPRVGGDILAWCTKCKMELAHVVVSMVGPRAARVICKTCKSEHNYRRIGDTVGAGKRSATTGARKTAVPRTTVRASEYWDQKIATIRAAAGNNLQLVPYAVTKTYAVGDVIQHARFGLGIVEEVKRGGKITVMFREGERILVHGMGAPAESTPETSAGES